MRIIESQSDPAEVLKAYRRLAVDNSKIHASDGRSFEQKSGLAKQMGKLWAREISPRKNAFYDEGPLMAADVTDVNLGTLSGTICAQNTLELFRLQFPVISRIYSDFAATPAQFKQTEATRIVIVPSVQSYNPALDGTGRPEGWSTISVAQTKDVLITLDEHIGIPIVFDANTLASTSRSLFEEQGPAAAYALAKYFVEKIYKLFTPANYNAYAVVNGAKVPAAYPTFPVAQGDFARSSLINLAKIFNPNEVPVGNRTALLTSSYYGQLANDPSLVTFYAGQRAPEIITDNELPKLGTFVPIEAPNLTAPNVTPNLVGMAIHRAGVVVKTRLPNDYTTVLPGATYGRTTVVTDAETGISVLLVEYVNHSQGYAEWRIQAMIGAAVGDPRGGLCITSQ
jgi:hypothetical protein